MTDFKQLLKELDELNLPKDSYAIFGSGPLAVRELIKTDDLDIFVKKELFKLLANKYKVTKKFGDVIIIDNIEIVSDFPPFYDNIDKFIDNSETISKHNFVNLKDTIHLKEIMKINKDKNKNHIKLINEYLKKQK